MLRVLRNKIFLGAAAILVAGAIFWKFSGDGNGAEIIKVKRADVIQEVVVTGKVKAQKEVSLGFDKTGRVVAAQASVGDKVAAGEVIAEIDTSSVLSEIYREQARLAEERAKLGGDEESLVSAIKEAYAAADNAVRNKADQFFKQPRENPRFEVKFTDGNFVHFFSIPVNLELELNSERRIIEGALSEWQAEISSLNMGNAEESASKALEKMDLVSRFLNKMALAVNSFTASDFDYESTVAGYKTAIDSGRTSVETKRSDLIAAKENFSKISDTEKLDPGQARIAQIEAAISSLESELRKSKITAPFSGTVTVQEAKVGSVALAGTDLVSLISESDMYVEANISEINIGKVNIGDPARVGFDAFPGEIFLGRVSYIEPGETIVDGVVNYKTRIEFDNFEEKIKSGLSANVAIEVGRAEQVLTLPSYAISEGQSGVYATVLESSSETREALVELGLVGSDGAVEIISGLSEGDSVVYKLK